MSGDVHVRFCESRGVQLPPATHLAVDDEELEQLLIQLDEVLVVDGRSVWRMLRRPVPEAEEDEDDGARLCLDNARLHATRRPST